jgi:cytochrome P450
MKGKWIPKGTIVETCTYTTARDPTVFRDPLIFDPSRWEMPTPEMKKMSRPFSYGPRSCIGQHLAEMALALTVARLYQLYDVIPSPEMTPEYMQQEDRGVLEPKNPHFYVTLFEIGGAAVQEK